jgi:hypothetical protein
VDERSIEVFVFCPFKNGMVNVPKLPCIGGILLPHLTQLKTPQIIDIVEIPPTQDIVQMPATQDIVESPYERRSELTFGSMESPPF